jgi:hypothetical protein
LQVIFLLVCFAVEDGIEGIGWTYKGSREENFKFEDEFYPAQGG